jgi:hypothetical protein
MIGRSLCCEKCHPHLRTLDCRKLRDVLVKFCEGFDVKLPGLVLNLGLVGLLALLLLARVV